MNAMTAQLLKSVVALLGTILPLADATAESSALKAIMPSDTPIAAELFSNPDQFIGRKIAIYGLVIEARSGGAQFLLQDVSEMPLVVIAPVGEHVAAGSQLRVYGTIQRSQGQLVLRGDRVEAVRVLAGGGCC